jgi:hypothetical protein
MTEKDQQEWYRKFYEGTFLIKGWKGRMNEILKGVPSEEKEEMGGLLENLGKKIGMEWARENDVRKIDTAQLQKWGKDLQNAQKKGTKALRERVRELNEEVDQLLA